MIRARIRDGGPPAPKRARDKPERRILVRAVAELRAAFALRGYSEPFPFFHAPNEGELVHGVREAQRRKQEGVTAGVPDLVVLARPSGAYRYSYDLGRYVDEPTSFAGAAIEIKAPRGRPSAEQLAMLEHFAAAGFAARVTVGHRETALTLRELGYIDASACAAWIAWAERADPGNL